MSSRDRLNYKKAMFNLRRERNIGHHITLQESNSLRLADERMEDELAKNILDFGETEDTVPTREDSIREEIVLEQDALPVNLATSPDPAVGPTRLPRTGQLTPMSGDLPRPTGDARGPNTTRSAGQAAAGGTAARNLYRDLLRNVATLIGRAAEPNSPNTILGALSSTPDNSSTPGTTPAPGVTPPTPGTTPPAPARAQLSIVTGGTQIQRNPPEVAAAGGKMYQLTLTQAGINRGADFNAVLTGIKSHIVRASQNSFGGRAGNINFNNIVQVVGGQGGTVVVRFPWADAQQANLRQKITEALQNAQRGELSRLGQITLIELPGDVRGETAATGGAGGTSPSSTNPIGVTPLPPLPGTTKAGIRIQRGYGSFRDEIWQVEVRLFGQIAEEGYTGPLSSEYMAGSSVRIANFILGGINDVFREPNNYNTCQINGSRTGFVLNYVPPRSFWTASQPSQTEIDNLYGRLRVAMDYAQSRVQEEAATRQIQLLLPFEPNYNIALPAPGSDQISDIERLGRAGEGGIRGTARAIQGIGNQALSPTLESYNKKNSLLSTRLQQLAGILKEQNVAQPLGTTFTRQSAVQPLGTTFTRQPAASATATASRPTATPTAPIAPVARPVAAAPAPPNPNVNRMIDQAIQNARRIAPQVTQLASNPAYSANRQKLQQLAQYLTGEFISSMNAAKNAPDTASKLRAVQAIYTPPNRGALLSNGLFDLGRLAASERR